MLQKVALIFGGESILTGFLTRGLMSSGVILKRILPGVKEGYQIKKQFQDFTNLFLESHAPNVEHGRID